jgi:hypothetical protein
MRQTDGTWGAGEADATAFKWVEASWDNGEPNIPHHFA